CPGPITIRSTVVLRPNPRGAPMQLRYLVGPVTGTFRDQNLRALCERGECLTFGGEGNDLPDTAARAWPDVEALLPAGWRPDFVAVSLSYRSVPAWVWSAPVPLVGLAPDWQLLWHDLRHRAARCDLVLTDRRGVEVMRRGGLAHARYANLFGLERAWLEE